MEPESAPSMQAEEPSGSGEDATGIATSDGHVAIVTSLSEELEAIVVPEEDEAEVVESPSGTEQCSETRSLSAELEDIQIPDEGDVLGPKSSTHEGTVDLPAPLTLLKIS